MILKRGVEARPTSGGVRFRAERAVTRNFSTDFHTLVIKMKHQTDNILSVQKAKESFEMKKWLSNLGYKYANFMIGRYGYDELSKTLNIVGLILWAISIFIPFIYPIALALVVWSICRTYSKNITKRQIELEKYFNMKHRNKKRSDRRKRMWNERKTHKYYKCKQCKTYLRVPKGKGKIEISCPKCKTVFIRRT